MRDDAIMQYFVVLVWRAVYFVGATVGQALSLRVWFWMRLQPERGWRWPLNHMGEAWPLDAGSLPSVLADAALWIGSANTTIVFLGIAMWWRHRADVMYRRGSRFIDERGAR